MKRDRCINQSIMAARLAADIHSFPSFRVIRKDRKEIEKNVDTMPPVTGQSGPGPAHR